MTDALSAARKLLQAESDRLVAALNGENSRRRGGLVRRLHEVRQMLLPDYTYSSQAGQDFVVDQLADRKRGGTFVDVGGYDGVTGSNSLFFETRRGWTGLLVEPVAAQLAKAKSQRSCPCLGVAVAPQDGEADFIEVTAGYTQMSGLQATYDPGLLETVRADERHQETVTQVPTRPLSKILIDADLPNPDFLSLDIEGGELACLETFPFAAHDIRFWAIENNTGTPQINKIMVENGYELVELCGQDEIYRKR